MCACSHVCARANLPHFYLCARARVGVRTGPAPYFYLYACVRVGARTGPIPRPYRSPERSPPHRFCRPASGKVMEIVLLVDFPQKGGGNRKSRGRKVVWGGRNLQARKAAGVGTLEPRCPVCRRAALPFLSRPAPFRYARSLAYARTRAQPLYLSGLCENLWINELCSWPTTY